MDRSYIRNIAHFMIRSRRFAAGAAFVGGLIVLPLLVLAADGSGTASVLKSPTTTLVNSTGNTLTFTFTAAESMNSGGISLSVPAGWSTPQGVVGTAGYTTVSTTGVVGSVFDEADSLSGWTHTTSNPTACSGGFSLDTTTKHSGTASIKCVNSSDSNNGLWYYSTNTAMDWSSYQTIGFWIYSSAPINNGDLKFDYSSNTNLSSPIESLSLGSSILANTWTYVSFNFGATTRTSIKSYGLHIANLSAMRNATVNIDSFSIGASASIIPTFSGNDILISAISLTNGQTITVTYGAGGGTSGAVAPATPQTSTFTVKSKTVDSGTLTNLAVSPTVSVIDTTVPTVSLTAPTTLSTVHGAAVALGATASDNVAVAGVTFYIDGVRSGVEDTAAPYASTFDSTAKSDGSHTLVAVARDTSSNYATSTAATVTIDNTGPVISAVASSATATSASVTWTTNEASDSKVAYGTSSGVYGQSVTSAPLLTSHTASITGLSDSTLYYFVVVSTDAYGNTATSSEKTLRTLDTTAPSVSLTAPTSGATIQGSSVSLSAAAGDSVAVAGVTFYVDGARVGSEDTGAPYTGVLDTTLYTNSTHSVLAVARDTSNNYATSSAAVVTVANPAPELSVVQLVSNNASSTLAKVGDRVTLTVTSSQALRALVTLLAGHGVSVATTSSTNYSASHVLTSDDTEGIVSLSATATNVAGLSAAAVTSTTDGSFVRFDKTAPTDQDSVLTEPVSTRGSATVTVVPSLEAGATLWLAPAGTTTFVLGATMTSASGSAESITAPSASGTYVLYVIDAAGNASVASLATVSVDNEVPELSLVTLTTSNAAGSRARQGDTVTLTFIATKAIREPSVTISSGGTLVTGPVTLTNPSGTTWVASYTVADTDTDGVVTFAIDGIVDEHGNVASAVSTTTNASSLVVDSAAPLVAVVSFVTNNASTTLARVDTVLTLTLDAGESITAPGVTLSSGESAVGGTVSVTRGSGTQWIVTYTMGSADTEGYLSYTIGGYTDAAGNDGEPVTETSVIRFHKSAPTVTLESDETDPTGNSPIEVRAVFSEAVTGFALSDIVVTNGTAGSLTGGGADYVFLVVPAANGLITVSVPAGAAQDVVGNTSAASNSLSRTFSSARPTVALSTGVGRKTKNAAITVTAHFSAGVGALHAADIAAGISNGSVQSVVGTDTTFTLTIVPNEEGQVVIQIPEGVTFDAETGVNTNFASGELIVEYDATSPVLTEEVAVPRKGKNRTPAYTFSSSEGGSITYAGGCASPQGSAVAGENRITFESLAEGTYRNCRVIVVDEAGNESEVLRLPDFTIDTTPPAVARGPVTPSRGAAQVAFTTNEAASAQIVYGVTASYGAAVDPSETVTGDTAHEATLSGLLSCVTYHYTASTTDEAGNTALGDDAVVTTRGCAGDANVISENDATISSEAGGTVSLVAGGKGVSLSVPSGFSEADAHFQIKKLVTSTALTALGVPSTYRSAGDYVYDLQALADVATSVHLFDAPLSVTVHYGASDVAGLDERSLKLYRNDDDVWTPLADCVVDTRARAITCSTEHFSTFSLFGQEAVAPTPEPTRRAHATTDGSVRTQVANLVAMGKLAEAEEVRASWPQVFAGGSTATTSHTGAEVRDLVKGMRGTDVQALQRVLIREATGPYARELERIGDTGYFWTATYNAVVEYQTQHGVVPHSGRVGPLTRGSFVSRGLTGLWW